MYLADLVLAVRQKLNELQPWLWSDQEIVDVLNEAATRMCSAAQFIQGFATFNSVANFQEYILPPDVDQIVGAAYKSGIVFPLSPAPRETMQIGGKVGGIPYFFYVKKQTRILTPMDSNANIEQIPLNPNDGGDSRTVIGLYPIPSGILPIYIFYIGWHPQMKNPKDICQVPLRFRQGVVAWAVARMKEKESSYDEAAVFDAQHDRFTQEFVDWMIQNGQEVAPPTYSKKVNSYFLGGSNVVAVVAQHASTTNL